MQIEVHFIFLFKTRSVPQLASLTALLGFFFASMLLILIFY